MQFAHEPADEAGGLRVALSSYRSKPHSGGQGIYVRNLSRELVALGHSVEVFSGAPLPELDAGVGRIEQALDLVEHSVDVLGQAIELVPGPAHRQALAQVPAHHPRDRGLRGGEAAPGTRLLE